MAERNVDEVMARYRAMLARTVNRMESVEKALAAREHSSRSLHPVGMAAPKLSGVAGGLW